MEQELEYLRCPRCGRIRSIVRTTWGYLNIKPGVKHTVDYLQCINPKCTKKMSFLVRGEDRSINVY